MRDRQETRRCENSKHVSHTTNYIQITLWLLRIFAFEFVLQSSFEFFASINLLVFCCLFLVAQRLGGWVLSKRLTNKSAWSSSSSEVLLRIFSDIINFRVFWVKIYFGMRRSRRHCYLKQKSVDCGLSAKNLCGKMVPTLMQNRRPDCDSRSVHSRFDVTA